MGSKCSWQSRIAVTLLVLVLATGALSGAVTAQDGTTVTVEDEETLSTGAEYGSAYSASSAETDEGTVSPTASDDERTVSPTASDDDGYERAVAVSVIPNGSSFGSDETMNILVGAFNESGFKQPIEDATLNVTVQRPDGTTSQCDRQTGADGDAEVESDRSNDNQNGT
jgi:hypothetical protein